MTVLNFVVNFWGTIVELFKNVHLRYKRMSNQMELKNRPKNNIVKRKKRAKLAIKIEEERSKFEFWVAIGEITPA